MVAIKSHQSEKFITAPAKDCVAFLLYGNDFGLISERAAQLAKRLAEQTDPSSEIIQILDTDLEESPDRFVVELQTQSMFGEQKIIRSSLSRRVNTQLIKPLIEDERPAGLLILEAGNLKPTDASRKLFEKLDHTAAIACYRDESRDLEKIIDEEVATAGLKIGREAKSLLMTRLGADRALSRSEIQKLTLYCANKSEIAPDDITSIVGDASELALDQIIYAAAKGDPKSAAISFSRAISSGQSPQTVIAATQRHFDRLHKTRTAMDSGRSLNDAIRALRPPIHFRQKDLFAAQTRRWSASKLKKALAAIDKSAKQARLNPALEAAIAERLVLALTRLPNY